MRNVRLAVVLLAVVLHLYAGVATAAPPKEVTLFNQWKAVETKRGTIGISNQFGNRPYFLLKADGNVTLWHVGNDYLIFATRDSTGVIYKIIPITAVDLQGR